MKANEMTLDQVFCLFGLEGMNHISFDGFVDNFWTEFSRLGGDNNGKL